MPTDPSQVLTPFGFTSLESEVYTYLLRSSPATGYRVAQAIGKPAANTYKAIESLQQKGAVLVEEGASRLCRAVPSGELLARLTRDFEWRRAEAELSLAKFDVATADDRIYALRSRSQAVERARHMLAGAQRVALMSAPADIARELSDSLASCVERKVRVFLLCPEAIKVPGVECVRARDALDDLRLAVDGTEMLCALMSGRREEVVTALWTRNVYLSFNAYRALASEIEVQGGKPPRPETTPGFARVSKT